MAIATRVVGDRLVAAVIALIHMATQGGGATAFDGAHGTALLWGQRGAVRVPVRGPY